MGSTVDVTGLKPLLATLKGPMFRDVNKELRAEAKKIAQTVVPHVSAAVAATGAPQSAAMADTVRAHSDRVPVVVVGKVNPKFRSGFRNKGNGAKETKLRRGSLAHGVVYGPKGGKRSTPAAENYYGIGRDTTGHALGRALSDAGPAMQAACEAYLEAFSTILRKHGFIGQSVKAQHWNGRG